MQFRWHGNIEKTTGHLASLRVGARFSNPERVEITNLELNLKVKIITNGTIKIELNRDNAPDHFLSHGFSYDDFFMLNLSNCRNKARSLTSFLLFLKNN